MFSDSELSEALAWAFAPDAGLYREALDCGDLVSVGCDAADGLPQTSEGWDVIQGYARVDVL